MVTCRSHKEQFILESGKKKQSLGSLGNRVYSSSQEHSQAKEAKASRTETGKLTQCLHLHQAQGLSNVCMRPNCLTPHLGFAL